MSRHWLVLAVCMFLPYSMKAKNDTTYFDATLQRCERANAQFIRVFIDTATYYKALDYYSNGRLYRAGYRTNMNSLSYKMRTGHYRYYDTTGMLQREGSFNEGLKVGLWNCYCPHSLKLARTEYYTAGRLTGRAIHFDAATGDAVCYLAYNDSGNVEYDLEGTDTTTIKCVVKKDKMTLAYYNKVHKLWKVNIYYSGALSSSSCYGETSVAIRCDSTTNRPTHVTQVPEPGYDLQQYIANHLHYPERAKRYGMGGKVYVAFTVEEDGTLSDIREQRGLAGEFQKAALDLVNSLPEWHAGTEDGLPVSATYVLPVIFKLE